jgi:mRNA (2'-O-methyladenosine-N6-)-methyltransferase
VTLDFAMTEDVLKPIVSTSLYSLFSSSSSVSTPITSLKLLAKLISSSHKPLPIRLHDLTRFQSILECLSLDWDHGTITLLRDNSELTIMDVNLVRQIQPTASPTSRKRKRVDEDAESDTEGDNEQLGESARKEALPTVSSLSNLSKEMKEVYAILQKPTAKGRLLAEQVCTIHAIFTPALTFPQAKVDK